MRPQSLCNTTTLCETQAKEFSCHNRGADICSSSFSKWKKRNKEIHNLLKAQPLAGLCDLASVTFANVLLRKNGTKLTTCGRQKDASGSLGFLSDMFMGLLKSEVSREGRRYLDSSVCVPICLHSLLYKILLVASSTGFPPPVQIGLAYLRASKS